MIDILLLDLGSKLCSGSHGRTSAPSEKVQVLKEEGLVWMFKGLGFMDVCFRRLGVQGLWISPEMHFISMFLPICFSILAITSPNPT